MKQAYKTSDGMIFNTDVKHRGRSAWGRRWDAFLSCRLVRGLLKHRGCDYV